MQNQNDKMYYYQNITTEENGDQSFNSLWGKEQGHLGHLPLSMNEHIIQVAISERRSCIFCLGCIGNYR